MQLKSVRLGAGSDRQIPRGAGQERQQEGAGRGEQEAVGGGREPSAGGGAQEGPDHYQATRPRGDRRPGRAQGRGDVAISGGDVGGR